MASIKNHAIFMSALLLLVYFVGCGNADIYLKLAARRLPNRGDYLNQNGSVQAAKTDAYVNVHINSQWNHVSQYTEIIDNNNNPDWKTIISVNHGRTIAFWVWDSDPDSPINNPDDSLGNTVAKVEDLHYLEFNSCYRYSLEHDADENAGQYLLVKRVASRDDDFRQINCLETIDKK